MKTNKKQSMWRSNSQKEKRRQMLKDILPLDTPLSIDIEACGACCLKCAYCPQSLTPQQKQEINIGSGVLSYSLFEKIVNDCTKFDAKLKSIRFAGFGEPLCNSDLPKMVLLAKEMSIAESVIIFTNGIMLTHDLSNKLVKAGVDTFLIDIQGVCEDDYLKHAGTKINFENLLDNLNYLAKLCKSRNTRIFIKTFKFMIENTRERFFELFEPIADEIGIENIYEIYPEIDYTGMITEEKETCGVDFYQSNYCSYPFFQMAINAYGLVTACTLPVSKNTPQLIIGDVGKESLIDIWNGNRLNCVRKMLLEDRSACKACEQCKYTDLMPKEDLIDDIVEQLKLYCNQKEKMVKKCDTRNVGEIYGNLS